MTIFSPGNVRRFLFHANDWRFPEPGADTLTKAIEWMVDNMFGTSTQIQWIALELLRPFHDNVFSMFMILSALLMLLGLWFAAPRHEGSALSRALAGRTYAAMVALLVVVSFLVSYPFGQWRATAGLCVLTSFSLLLFRTASATPTGQGIICVHVAGLAALLPILLAPVQTYSIFSDFLTLQLAPVAYAIVVLGPMRLRHATIAAILILGGLSVKSAAEVFDGYRSNRIVHEVNDAQLRVRNFMQRMGMTPDGAVTLFMLKDRRWAIRPPYEGGGRKAERWIKKYYRLDPDMEFVWK